MGNRSIIVTGVWTGVGFSNLKNSRTRIQNIWSRSGVGVWKSDANHLCYLYEAAAAIWEGFYRAGDFYEAGLVHAQYHRFLPTERHWNFEQHFRTFLNFWLNLKTFVRVLVQKSRIPSNWDQHFGISSVVMQQRALSIFKKKAALRWWQFDNVAVFADLLLDLTGFSRC